MITPTKIKLAIPTLCIVLASCSSSDPVETNGDDNTNDNNSEVSCTDLSKTIYNENNSIILVEFENTIFGSEWELVEDTSNATGRGYMMWNGNNHFSSPGNGLASYKIRTNNPGIYRFIWRSSVKEGTNSTESNDTWLRFSDADDFYGQKTNGNTVYPRGTGKSPNPEGASSDGWFKIYRSGNDLDFKWQSFTNDHDGHDIYVVFNSVGDYTMEISGRSKGHAIDKFMLYQPSVYSQNEAIGLNNFSEASCQ